MNQNTEGRFAYLLMVDPICNNNKFYQMTVTGDTLICKYGRVGQEGTQTTYPASRFDSIYRQKTGKGYQDRTHLVSVPTVTKKGELEYKEIDDELVRELVERLQMYAHQTLTKNYNVSYKKVTKKMISEAQKLIQQLSDIFKKDDISDAVRIHEFNEVLSKLFTVIPRKMQHVASHLANETKDLEKILKKEQNLLDVMKGQIDVDAIEEKASGDQECKNNFTILEKLGIEIYECTKEDMETIKGMYNGKRPIKRAFRAINKQTEGRYQKYVEEHTATTPMLLWHGTRNENVWSILGTGLMLNPKAVITGKMFGHGIYFAPSAQKSLGYTSLDGSYWAGGRSDTGFMLIFETAYGNPLFVHRLDDHGSLNSKNFEKRHPGHQVLHAKAGKMLRNDEIIFYHEDQMTVRYIVEF